MNWNDLSLLLAVSRSKTMTEAAEGLGVNQTTVSRRLAALEENLGVALVHRQRDGVGLTEAGVLAARSAGVMETTANDLERELLGRDRDLAGTISVSATDAITCHHPDLFTSFAKAHPSVDLEVDTDSSPRSLTRREADVVIRWTLTPDPGLFGRKLVQVEYALFVAKTLFKSMGKDTDPAAYPWVAFTAATNARMIDAWMRAHVPDATIVCRYTHTMSMQMAIRAGSGIGIVPCAHADPDPGLVRLSDVLPGFGYELWILTHPDLSRTGRVRAFLSHAGAYFDARRMLYAGEKGG